ncbi:MAG: PHP domain-containing protein [Acutalibacter sp.]|nr:PHP domain-containing protein [Acutalibacter sp.]
MAEYRYDFHIHSCLSPCGDNDMTPSNIAGMAALMGLDIIAITDHNTSKNAASVMAAGQEAGVLVIPGMELCTAEEAHIVCLFETLEGAMGFDGYIYKNMPHIANKAEIFGEQRMLSWSDELVGQEENLLLVSSFVGVDDVCALAKEYGGIALPAHVNRDSYSVIAALGSLPPEVGFAAFEATRDCDMEALFRTNPELEGLKVVRDSDSHYLETLAESEAHTISLPEKSARAVLQALGKG